MSLMHAALAQAISLFKQAQLAAHEGDTHEYNNCMMQIEAIFNQQVQFIDEELNSSHELRKQAVGYVGNLEDFKDMISKNSTMSALSNFDKLEELLMNAGKNVFLLEYELKRSRPQSMLLQND